MKVLKIVVIVLMVYVAIVVVFESMLVMRATVVDILSETCVAGAPLSVPRQQMPI